jgi:hypothetical protein
MIQPLTVLGFGYVGPYAGAVEPRRESAESELPKLDLTLLERTLRRGLSEVTRLFMHVAQLALTDAKLAPDRVQVIFASAFGEIATAEALLAQAFDANASSPARFRHSVHNTAPGLLSISTKNRLPSTAMSAGWETVAMGLFEAAAQLADQADCVLLVFAEERVPLALSAEHDHGPLAAALVLTRAAHDAHASGRATLSRLRRLPRAELAAPSELELDDHPLAPLRALARALERGGRVTLPVSDGATPWCIELDASLARPDAQRGPERA